MMLIFKTRFLFVIFLLIISGTVQSQDGFKLVKFKDKAELEIVKKPVLKNDITNHEVTFEKNKTQFILTEISYFEHYDITDGLAFDNQDNTWFVSARHNRVVKIDPTTLEVVEYQLPKGLGPRVLYIDDKGTHWIAAQLAQLILECYPEEGKAIVHNPEVGAWMNYIAMDQEKDILWYNLPPLNVLGRFDKENGFKGYEIPTFDSGPGGLDVDLDGNVWLAQIYGNKIARFDPQTEEFTEYELPTESALPFSVMIDSENTPWVGEHNTDKVACFKNGVFTEYELPNPNSGINSLSEAPDGTIWFSEGGWRGNKNGNRIGRLDPKTAEIDEVTLPTPNSQPQSLKVNNKGEVWFIEMGTGRIARLAAAAKTLTGYNLK